MSIAARIVGRAKRYKSIALRRTECGRYLTQRKAVVARHKLIRRLWQVCGDDKQISRLMAMDQQAVRRVIRSGK